jgi:tetratricopeptide (TPR) repeat protein
MLARRPGTAALTRASYLRELHGDLPGAVNAMAQAVVAASTPADRAVALTLLSHLHLTAGQVDAARSAAAEAAELDPDSVPAALAGARADVAAGELGPAEARLSSLAERSPQAGVATLLAEVRLALGEEATAALELVEANSALLRAAGVRTDLDAALFEADHGNPVTAVELARAAYGERRTVLTADALGWALTRAGRPGEARPFVDEALALGTRSPNLLLHAALALHAAGADERAAGAVTDAFTASPALALGLQRPAVELAATLGVAVPPSWSLP